MDFPKIESPKQANLWLADKPADWKKVIYARSALRAVPTMAGSSENWLRYHAISIFQSNLVAWIALNDHGLDVSDLAESAEAALQQALRRAYDDNLASEAIFGANSAVRVVVGEQAEDLFEWREGLISANPDLAETLREVSDRTLSIAIDCYWLGVEGNSTGKGLVERELWLDEPWTSGRGNWSLLRATLRRLDPSYSVWIDWYERRIRGDLTSFDIPGDKGGKENGAILRRLAKATDKDFWGKGATYVNTTLQSWIDDARTRVAPPPPDPQAARLEAILARIDAGVQADFSTPEAKAALESLEAAIADAAPQPGSNFFETDDVLPGDADPTPPAQALRAAELEELNAKLLDLEKAAKAPQPDAIELGKKATWIKAKLDKMRKVAPDFTKKFEEGIGTGAAVLVTTGAGWLIAKFSGVLDSLLGYLEAGLAIVRSLPGL